MTYIYKIGPLKKQKAEGAFILAWSSYVIYCMAYSLLVMKRHVIPVINDLVMATFGNGHMSLCHQLYRAPSAYLTATSVG